MSPLQFLPASEVMPDMLEAAAVRFPFPRGLRLAYEQGALRFAMIGDGGAAVLHVAVTDSLGRAVALAPLLDAAEMPNASLQPFTIIGDGALPVGLVDAHQDTILLLVRGADDVIAAREVWPHSKTTSVIGMLEDRPISPAAIELMRGRCITLVDFGGVDGAFAFGGWQEQLRGVGATIMTLGSNGPRFPACGFPASVAMALRIRSAFQEAKIPVQKLTSENVETA